MQGTDYSTLFELLPIGAYRSDARGWQLRANAALVRLNGYDTEREMLAAINDIGLEWYVDAGRRQHFLDLMARDGGVVNFVSEVYRHKTRERIWVRENAHVMRDSDGQVLFFEGTVEDITESQHTLQALVASERRFRALTERATIMTMVCDRQGVIPYASHASQAMIGIAAADLQGSSLFEHMHPDDMHQARVEMQHVVIGRDQPQESICRYLHGDGSWRVRPPIFSTTKRCAASY